MMMPLLWQRQRGRIQWLAHGRGIIEGRTRGAGQEADNVMQNYGVQCSQTRMQLQDTSHGTRRGIQSLAAIPPTTILSMALAFGLKELSACTDRVRDESRYGEGDGVRGW